MSAQPIPIVVPQPNQNGEFTCPSDGALWMASNWGIPQIPLRERDKRPVQGFEKWQNRATTDPLTIQQWARQFPGCNFASVALKHVIFETDSPEVVKRFKQQGGRFTSRLLIMSKKGGHRYYDEPVPGLLDKTIAQSDTKQNDFSVRVKNAYCVSPGSIHPSGAQYRVVISPENDWPNAPAVPTEQEIAFWLSEKKSESKPADDTDGPIIAGGRNNTLTSIGGGYRYKGMNHDEIEMVLLRINRERCKPPLDESEVKVIASSVGRYPVGPDTTVLVDGKPAGSNSIEASKQPKFEIDESEQGARPDFPQWVMEGTGLYEGLAKPVSDVNSKYPELIWLPAVQLMLNYLHNKVRIENLNLSLNLFLGVISPPGKFFKSSSCRLGHDYFKNAGLAETSQTNVRNSEGRIMIGQAGSSEGFGLRMAALNAKHAVLFNDELGKLAAKAGIENAALPHDLLSWYENDDFANEIKSAKQSFSFPAGTYCFGWQFCTTTAGFNRHWAKLAGVVSGLEDRCFFLVTPDKPKPLVEETNVNCFDGAMQTRRLIDKAIAQGVYTLEDKQETRELAAAFGDPRSMNMVYKFALYFAVDLDRPEIDADCVERAVALVKYRQQTTAHLAPIEADNQQARLQQEIIRALKQNSGQMTYRQLCRNVSSWRIGSFVWNAAYKGLIDAEDIFELKEQARGTPKRVVALRKWDD